MKGLVLTYLVATAAIVGGLRYPVFALSTYIAFAVLRPQSIFGFAGDISGMSFWVGVVALVGWALHGFGSWRFGRGNLVVTCLLLYVVWFSLASVIALEPGRAYSQLPVLARFILPLLVGATL